MLFQKSPEFSTKSSIRRKILLPFSVILIVMALASLYLSYHFITKISADHMAQNMVHYSTIYQHALSDWATQQDTDAPTSKMAALDDKLSDFLANPAHSLIPETVSTALLRLDDMGTRQITVLGATNELTSDALSDALKQIVFQPRNFGRTTFHDVIRLNREIYYFRVAQSSFDESVSTVILIKSTGALVTTLKILGTVLGVIILISLIILAIYTLIVRKITTSLDILSTVASQVAQGDLDQHIYLESSDEIGRLSSIFNTMTSSLKEARNNLVSEKNRSEAIIACIPEGIIVTDNENRLIVANQKAENMLNFSLSKVQGKFLLEYINNEDLVSILRGKLSGNVPLTREVVIPAKEGKDKIYELTSSLVKNKKKHIGVITILRDITHDRELDALRDGFLRAVSHELRTPLTSIIGFMDLLIRGAGGDIGDKQKELLQISLNEAESLKSLIDDLLDLSRINAGQMDIQPTDINVLDLFNGIVASFTPLAKANKLELSTDFGDETLVVQADQPKVRRVLLNLVSNALKFTPEGSVTLSAEERGDDVVFAVSDTGIGLLEDEREIIFEKFRQVDYSSTRKYEGIGLGLSIVQQLVEMHNGTVWVESEYEKGSTFYFSIPKVAKVPEPVSDSAADA